MAGLSISGQMKVSTLQKGFLKEFGLTLRVYDGREFADPTQTLAQVRKKKGSGKGLSVAKNMKVGNLEDKFEEEFGLKIQVAGSDDSYLCKNELTLNAAQQEDEKKLTRKELKAARQEDSSDDASLDASDEEAKTYFINHDKSRDACSIIWESDEYVIGDLEPYIYAIQCDDGEDFYDLLNADWPDADGKDDFKTLELNNFQALEGDCDNEYLLCFTALISTNLDKHPNFRNALEKSESQVVARIQFKKDGKPILDKDGYEEFLYEMVSDTFVGFELDD